MYTVLRKRHLVQCLSLPAGSAATKPEDAALAHVAETFQDKVLGPLKEFIHDPNVRLTEDWGDMAVRLAVLVFLERETANLLKEEKVSRITVTSTCCVYVQSLLLFVRFPMQIRVLRGAWPGLTDSGIWMQGAADDDDETKEEKKTKKTQDTRQLARKEAQQLRNCLYSLLRDESVIALAERKLSCKERNTVGRYIWKKAKKEEEFRRKMLELFQTSKRAFCFVSFCKLRPEPIVSTLTRYRQMKGEAKLPRALLPWRARRWRRLQEPRVLRSRCRRRPKRRPRTSSREVERWTRTGTSSRRAARSHASRRRSRPRPQSRGRHQSGKHHTWCWTAPDCNPSSTAS